MPVLHGTLDETTFLGHGSVAEILQGEVCLSLVFIKYHVRLCVLLQVVEHVKIGLLENVKIQVIVQWRDPPFIFSVEETELFGEVILFDFGS